ncbi:MAG TPA: hypothetical protein VFM98_12885, partial [Ramlibacter sp.]|nr:hypothetical protein [Ramlibacter sp.]
MGDISTRPLQADPERERLDAEYMGRAIQASRESLEAGDMPYGAVLVSGGGDLLPIRCAQTLAGAVPPVQVDGPMEA